MTKITERTHRIQAMMFSRTRKDKKKNDSGNDWREERRSKMRSAGVMRRINRK